MRLNYWSCQERKKERKKKKEKFIQKREERRKAGTQGKYNERWIDGCASDG